MTVAALYIDPRGPYPKLLGPELCWDETRDARLYDGPHPVIAHPPCGPWSGKVRKLYKGNEHDCAPRAIEQVRKWGGVLEHPAHSKLFGSRLPLPGHLDQWGWTLPVEQVSWGHVARKPTWVYIVGAAPRDVFPLVRRGGTPTHWCGGGRTKSSRTGSPIPPGIKAASSQQKRRTPPAFAEFLIALAEQARPAAARVA